MKYILFYLLVITSFSILSQSENNQFNYSDPSSRSKQLFFKIGTEYRITPLDDISDTANRTLNINARDVNPDLFNSGPALSIGLEYFVTKNFSLGFDNTLRYDSVLFELDNIESDFGSTQASKSLIFGSHLHANYFIKAFKNSEIFLRLGISGLNSGVDVVTRETFRNEQGEIIGGGFGTGSLSQFAGNIAIGYRNKRIELLLGVYISDGAVLYTDSFSYVIPYLKLTYNLGKL